MAVRNLIFDVGDVLLGYRWREMFAEHGISPEDAERIAKEMFEADTWFVKLDSGLIGTEGAIEEYGRLFPDDIETIAWFLHNAKEMVVPRPAVWEKIAVLKKRGYGLYILSNYSKELFEQHTEGLPFMELLDGAVVSYQVGKIKPDEGIYRALLEKYDLKPEECLFFDDRKANVEAAEKMGIKVVQVLSEKMLERELDGLLG